VFPELQCYLFPRNVRSMVVEDKEDSVVARIYLASVSLLIDTLRDPLSATT
jgi:hypothetical protein